MKVAIISDVHANYEALTEALNEIDNIDVDSFWILGDLVGYGPLPDECVDKLKKVAASAVAGNHDLGAIQELDIENFNVDGREAIVWQRRRIGQGNLNYLRSLPVRERPDGDILLVHGSPRQPSWEYVLTSWIADENFELFKERICFFGHTHLPVAYRKDGNEDCTAVIVEEGSEISLEEGGVRWMINPGSIGQPRDGDPRAAFALYDTEKNAVRFIRVEYDIEVTQEIMRKFGLPPFLRERLSRGI